MYRVQTEILNRTTVFNTDNDKKSFLSIGILEGFLTGDK